MQLPTVLWLPGEVTGYQTPLQEKKKKTNLPSPWPCLPEHNQSIRTLRPCPSSPFQIPCEGLIIDPVCKGLHEAMPEEVQSLKRPLPGRDRKQVGVGWVCSWAWCGQCYAWRAPGTVPGTQVQGLSKCGLLSMPAVCKRCAEPRRLNSKQATPCRSI